MYFEPKYEEFRLRTIWSHSNAFTSAFKELAPIPQFKAKVLALTYTPNFLGGLCSIAVRASNRPCLSRCSYKVLQGIQLFEAYPPNFSGNCEVWKPAFPFKE